MHDKYQYINAYFRTDDPHPDTLNGFEIPEGWWSRRYEYDFAMSFAQPGQIVADMGCGWHYRPLHDALCNVCDFVYGVDHHEEVLELPAMTRGEFVVADFSKPIEGIPAGSLDRIFCISVLEELFDYGAALKEFHRLLKPDGLAVVTLDMPYDETKPAHDKYKGIRESDFYDAVRAAGLYYQGRMSRIKPANALFNSDFNLCVWHCILEKRDE